MHKTTVYPKRYTGKYIVVTATGRRIISTDTFGSADFVRCNGRNRIVYVWDDNRYNPMDRYGRIQ